MANMCYNTIVFYGDFVCIKELYSHIERIHRTNDDEKQYNDYTMLAEAYNLNLAEAGWFMCLEDVDVENDEITSFRLDTETKWVPKEEIFNAICKHYKGKINYVYMAEEIGFKVFVNTDVQGIYFIDRYYVDGSGDLEPLYTDDWNDVTSLLKELYPNFKEEELTIDNLDEINRILRNNLPKQDENDDNPIQVYKYEEEFK